MADLTFDILARDRASKVLKNVGDSADGLYGKLQKLDGVKAGALAAGLPALGGIAGLMLAGAGAAGVLAPALVAVSMATKGVGDAWSASTEKGEEYQAKLDELSPSAAAAVQEAVALRTAWSAVGDAVQEAAFAPVVGDLSQLSNNIIPALKADLPDVAAEVGNVASDMMEWAGSAEVVARIRTTIQGSVPVIRDFGDSLEDVADTWSILSAGAVPVAQELSSSLSDITARTREWATEAEKTGELDAIMNSTAQTVDLLMQNVENLGAAMGTLAANPATIDALNDLLQILTAVTGGVAALAGVFTSLPDGLQEFILVAAGAAVAASKVNTALGSIGGGAEKAKAGLDGAEKSTSRFAGVADKLGSVANVAAAGLVGLNVVAALISQGSTNASVGVEALENSLVKFNSTGEASGEILRLTGGDMEHLRGTIAALDTEGMQGFTNSFARFVENISGATGEGTLKEADADIAKIDATLAQMVAEGNADQAAEAYKNLREVMKGQNVDADEFAKGFDKYNAAVKDSAAAADTATAAQKRIQAENILLKSSFEAATASVGGLDNAFKILNGETQNLNSAFAAWQQSLDAMTSSTVNAKAGFDLTTEAGRQNYTMLQNQVTALQAYASQANLTGPEIENLRQQIINQGVAAGISRDQMTSMVNSIMQIPGQAQPAATSVAQLQARINELKSKQVEIKESGSADSKQRIASLQAEINALRDKTVYLTTVLRQRTEVVGSDGLNRRFGGGYAKGGIQMYAAASGLVANIAKPGTIYQWAEPETGGEAFIPRKGDKERSRSILKYVADEWLGGPEAIWGGGGKQGAAPPSSVGGFAGGKDGASSIIRELRELQRVISTMGISIDGQQLGRAQGRRTLLEQYGG